MCLDWIGQPDVSGKYYSQAELLDPNGFYMVSNLGWHYVQVGDYPAARQYFLRAAKLGGPKADIALNYLNIGEAKLDEKASGRPQLPAVY